MATGSALKDSPRGADGWWVGQWLPGCGRHPDRRASCRDSPALGSRNGDCGAGGGRPGQPLHLQLVHAHSTVPLAQPGRGRLGLWGAHPAQDTPWAETWGQGTIQDQLRAPRKSPSWPAPSPTPGRSQRHSTRPQAPLFLRHLLRSIETR